MKDLVRDFLLEFKKTAMLRGIDLVPRNDTLITLSHLGLTKKNAKDCILALSVENYSKGPIPDDKGREGDLWEFGCVVKGQEIYVKLKVANVGSEKIAKCISFHIPVYPINYPLNGSEMKL